MPLWAVIAAVVALSTGSDVRTECYASFGSASALRSVERTAARHGFESEIDRRGGRLAVTFRAFYVGERPREVGAFAHRFDRLVEAAGGERGHPGTGCLDKPYFT